MAQDAVAKAWKCRDGLALVRTSDLHSRVGVDQAVTAARAAEIAADLPADLMGQGFTAQKLDRQSPWQDLPVSASAAGDRQIALDTAQSRPDVRHGSAEGG